MKTVYMLDIHKNKLIFKIVIFYVLVLCQIAVGPQFQNFMSYCCIFPCRMQGLRKFGLLP